MATFYTEIGSISNLQISGTLVVSGSAVFSGSINAGEGFGGFTGSLLGTASFVSGNIFDSTNNALSASYSTTSSYSLNAGVTSFNTRIGDILLQPSDISGLGAGILSASSFTSPSQGTLRPTINGVAQSDVDLGLQSGDDVTFNTVLATNGLTGSLTASSLIGDIRLGVQTSGDYVSTLTQGNSITITSATGEGSNPTIAVSDTITGNKTFSNNVIIQGNLTAQQFIVSSSVYNITTSFSSGSTIFGNDNEDVHQFTGSLRVLGSITGSISASNLVGDIRLGNQTSGDYVSTLTQGTGVTVTGGTGEGSTPTIAIGQAVGTTSNVQFNQITGSIVSASQFTGSLFGTSSWATNFLTSSVTSASFLNQLNQNLVVTGSVRISGSATTELFVLGDQEITGSLKVTNGITGSVFGSSSWALNSITASYFITSSVTSASFAGTASFVNSLLQNVTITGSLFVSNSIVLTPSGSIVVISGSIRALSLTGSLSGTASWANNFLTSSVTSASFANTASWANNFLTSSVTSASFASTASYITGAIFNSTNLVVSASYSITASYALNGGGVTSFNSRAGAVTLQSSDISGLGAGIVSASSLSSTTQGIITQTINGVSANTNITDLQTSSRPTFAGVTSSLFGTASWANNFLTSSVTSASFANTASWANNFLTSSVTSASLSENAKNSVLFNGVTTGSFISTGSVGVVQTISGSLIINQNLSVFGTSSILYVTSSQLDISTNLITVNTQNPNFRFGGLAVIDSGSSPLKSGSILYDSVQDEWIFVHRGASNVVTSSHFLVGPETYNDLGNETYVPQHQILRSVGNEHITGSRLSDNGILISLNGNTSISGSTIVTGSLIITGSVTTDRGFTGSLFGTASYVTGSIFNSSNTVLSASFASTASYSLNGGVISFNTRIGAVTLQSSDISGLGAGIISASSFTSPSQGTLRATINGTQTDVDLGVQSVDDVTFNKVTATNGLTGSLTASSLQGDIRLGVQTSGDYVSTLTQGTGVTVTGGTGEGSTPTIAIGQAVSTTSNVQFNQITGSIVSASNHISGGQIIASTGFTGSLSASFLKGAILNSQLQNSTISGISLGGTLATLTAGTGISSAGTYDGSTSRTFSIGQDVSTTANVLFANITGSTISASNFISGGQIIASTGFTGSLSSSFLKGAILNSQLQNSSVTIGNTNIVLGGTATTITGLTSVSSTSITGSIISASQFSGSISSSYIVGDIILGTQTTGSYIGSIVQGTGVIVTNGSGEGISTTIAIGQAVGTTSNVQFNQITASIISSSIGITGSLFGTASRAITASYITGSIFTSTNNVLSASYALTASYALNGGGGGSNVSDFPYTGSAIISGSLTVTGSLYVSGTIYGDGGGIRNLGFGDTRKLTQDTIATTWSFTHNMAERYPVVTIYDNNDNVVVPGRIESVDENTLKIYFKDGTAGTAVASVGGNAVTASYIQNAVTIGTTNLFTEVTSSLTATTTTISRVWTGSYSGAFWDYVVNNSTNFRAGTIMSVWNKVGSAQYTDTSTPDVGDTSQLTFGVIINGEYAELRATTSTSGWNIKTFKRSI